MASWSIRPTSLFKENLQGFEEKRSNGPFPPHIIAQPGSPGFSNESSEIFTTIVEERSSSLVITGNSSGYLWICSIWSSLTNPDVLPISVQSLLRVLGQFINQQACARCLAFLILLGHLCERLAAEYEMILSRLDVILGLGVSLRRT